MQNISSLGNNCTLITTDIWGFNNQLDNTYFLGFWCFSSLQDEIRAEAAGKIIPYHWDDRDKLRKDFDCVSKLNEELLSELSVQLNQIHGLSADNRFWRVIIGYWLNIFTTVIYDRWASLKEAVKLPIKWQTHVTSIGYEELCSKDTSEFCEMASESSVWNHGLFSLLSPHFPEIKHIPIDCQFPISAKKKKSTAALALFKHFLKNAIASRFFSFLKRNDRYFLFYPGLTKKLLVKLELSLGQIPLPRRGVELNNIPHYDPNFRRWKLASKHDHGEFDSVVRELIPGLMPRIFLEGFKDLVTKVNALPWPAEPKVIFTSSQHFTNDTFKVWAAQKLLKGSRMIIGEHGGTGVGLFNGAHQYELSIADIYVSTGWDDASKKNIRAVGHFRDRMKGYSPRQSGRALMVCGNMPRFSFDMRAMTLSSQVLDYFADQFTFVDALPARIKDQILIRLYPKDYGWKQRERWKERHPDVAFDDSKKPMLEVASDCRLFIATYAATTYIESLTSNFPTVIFWNPLYWELKPEAVPYFDKLKMVGVFHESAVSAAHHVSHVWDDVLEWWHSDSVQSARMDFCERYANTSVVIDKRLRQILFEEAVQSRISN